MEIDRQKPKVNAQNFSGLRDVSNISWSTV